jgi:hypothetical protein
LEEEKKVSSSEQVLHPQIEAYKLKRNFLEQVERNWKEN